MADWRTNDRELLARILMAEAGNQGPIGMTAVGNVIMNRANTSGYGDGIRGVIMKPGQFSPMNSVTGYAGGEQGQNIDSLRPSETHYMVADTLLSGNAGDITGGATHFFHDGISNPSWAKGKDFKRIGDHVFGSADAGRGGPQATTIAQGASPMTPTQTQPQPQGILEMMGVQRRDPSAQGDTALPFYQRDQFKDMMGGIAMAANTLRQNPDKNINEQVMAGRDKRDVSRRSVRTAQWLSQQPNGQAFVEMLKAGADPTAVLQAYQKETAGVTAMDGVQSSTSLPDQSGVIMTMRDGSVVVKTIGGETLTGQAALDFAKAANEAAAAYQQDIYAARREGTLGADIELGGAAASAVASGELTAERGFAAYDNAVKAGGAIATMDRAIAAIDAGAQSGLVYNMMPNVTEASASLKTAMNQMGLDVISSVTFGALSAPEMALAMETAVPQNLAPQALRSYLVEKRDAQEKAREALLNAARYLTTPGNTIAGWMDQQGKPAATSAPAPSAPAPSDNALTDDDLKYIGVGGQ